jgi:hypothetical protein
LGYDFHITRARRSTDSEAHPITLEEWRACSAADPELEMTGVAEAETPSGVLRYESPGLAIWRAHPDGAQAWFDCRDGEIVVKNPDDAMIAKMIALAGKLGARVQGDDGEVYEQVGHPPIPPKASLWEHLQAWAAKLRPTPKVVCDPLPFGVGDRVRDPWAREATVTGIDLRAEHGMGVVRVRFDNGREATFFAVAHGLTAITPPGEPHKQGPTSRE